MKLKIAALLASALFIICGAASSVSPNPFGAQIKKPGLAKKTKNLKSLLYKGYALIGEGKIAFAQYGGRQYILEKGDKLQNLQIIDIREEYIVYKLNNKICRAVIEVDKK